MPWFKVDDRFHSSRKVKALPKSIRLQAVGLWTLAGSWSASEGLDGFVPDYMIEDFGGSDVLVAALIGVGLWEEMPDGTQFYKWTEYNPDAASIEAAKDAQSDGAKHANHRRWHSKRNIRVPGCEWCESVASGAGQLPDQYTGSQANPPDPARPEEIPTSHTDVPVGKGVQGGARGTRIPAPFILTADMKTWAATNVPDVDVNKSTQMFVDHFRAEAGARARKVDWVATWRNWLRRDADKTQPSRATRGQENLAYVASLMDEQGAIEA